MILWVDGAHDPIENMRRDCRLLAAAEAGAEPVLRLFQFRPHGITLGARQTAERELDLDRCAADRVAWAVRPTGGRALFHAQEWTYALASPLSDPQWGGSLQQAYVRVGERIAASLRSLGAPAFLARRERDPARAPAGGRGPAPPCFASTARHEIVLDGRKLVGSAQRRTRRALLQQGSILLGEGHLRIADYLALGDRRRQEVAALLGSSVTHLGGRLPSASLNLWAESLERLLPPGTRRLDGVSGAFLLTLPRVGSYTASLLELER